MLTGPRTLANEDPMKETPALLMLEDGTCFEGTAVGMKREAAGEVVFGTGMVGYQETLTDPSHHGQIVTFTAAHIGDYGATDLDDQSGRFGAGGAVFHDLTPRHAYSNWRARESLDDKLTRMGMTAITGVDTRALTLHLREHGSKNGIISAVDLDKASLLRRAKELPAMVGLDLASRVTTETPYIYEGSPIEDAPDKPKQKRYSVAVYDFGIRKAMLDDLVRVGAKPTVWPVTTPVEEVLKSNPHGVFLSSGPGDPSACDYAVKSVQKLLGRVPVFGICFGHQILARALGAKIYKMKFGHHGGNHPVKDVDSGRVAITSQNHGFCVDVDSLPTGARVSHWNLNDDTMEGLIADNLMAFSVQFHPEACAGPNDTKGLFSRFRNLMQSAQSLF